MDAHPPTVPTAAAARLLGFKPNTLEKMRIAGTGPRYLKLGRAVRYRVADLEEYMNARSVQSTSEQVAA